MVPGVLWNKEDEEVVVHNYDIADAAREGMSEEKIRDAIGMDGYCDCIVRSSVSEIKQWAKDGANDVDEGTETSLIVILKNGEFTSDLCVFFRRSLLSYPSRARLCGFRYYFVTSNLS